MMRMLTTGSDAARGDGQVAADVGGRRVGATVYAPKLRPNHRARHLHGRDLPLARGELQCGGAISSEVKRNSRARSLHNRFLSCRMSIVNPTLEPTATSPTKHPPSSPL